MNFADRLIAAIKAKNSVVCVGLDPRLNQIPACIIDKAVAEHDRTRKAAAVAFLEFNKGIIDTVKDLCPIVKPQIAFYEQYGSDGYWAYEETCKYAQEAGLLVLADAKRNDIGSTAAAYAGAFLGDVDMFGGEEVGMDVDALTINSYLGLDGVKPFMDACDSHGKGIFTLVKTSNPSSGDIQDRVTVDENISVAELMAHFVDSWGSDLIGESGYSSVGAVVGATYPAEAAKLRKLMPTAIFLVPGYGAQGGGAEDVKPCFNEDGQGAIVNSSRGIIFAYEKVEGPADGSHYAEAAANAVKEMNEAINSVR
ncbi:orotidine-5'-phosphate decarboxylase [Candidatus Peregrinibacteria bacterium]|jgi:orotidine-5'-phosphate decarboxylase|nr:orotidine-5'-phosphate decarboxylase [Candidatus Peregrinibacteria bacterium]MBT4631661.1 orotidine-5'-phosphate decarboxylase [Candidatus Peregrinibacteria bacterium]MBT5516789.1 orotidine-5'-phosphate decarboxylase [Candidatus Peregrinibacteria bacterium]MBT5823929.1 orotidine-5'-phosphate decarboxylase [Candidatus Peregrinibacteria bacterium]